MNDENTRRLHNAFPFLYRKVRCFECGDGWYQLIYELSAAIEEEARKSSIDPASESWPMARQVKEKFSTLRFYVSTDSVPGLKPEVVGDILSFRPVASVESIQKLVAEAEAKSANICEVCGKPGTLRTDGFWRVICDTCEHKRNELRKMML